MNSDGIKIDFHLLNFDSIENIELFKRPKFNIFKCYIIGKTKLGQQIVSLSFNQHFQVLQC